jgi:chemotaxis protein CheX
MKTRKNILMIVSDMELEKEIRENLPRKMSDPDMSVVFIHARDGAEAAVKADKQRFDLVLMDSECPRMKEGWFVHGLSRFKNTQDAKLIVLGIADDNSTLPEAIRKCKYFKKPTNNEELMASIITMLNYPAGPMKASEGTNIRYVVDVRVINAVIKATLNILGQFGVTSITMDKAGPKSPHEPLMGEVSSVVDIESQTFQGFLAITFDKASYLEVVSTIMQIEQTELTEENQSAVGEINNIIFANAKAEISNFGAKMKIPRILLGANQVVPCVQGSGGMLIPFNTNKGKFHLLVVAFPAMD